jgi:hypothetical protein
MGYTLGECFKTDPVTLLGSDDLIRRARLDLSGKKSPNNVQPFVRPFSQKHFLDRD